MGAKSIVSCVFKSTADLAAEQEKKNQTLRELIWQDFYIEAQAAGFNNEMAKEWADQNTKDYKAKP